MLLIHVFMLLIHSLYEVLLHSNVIFKTNNSTCMPFDFFFSIPTSLRNFNYHKNKTSLP